MREGLPTAVGRAVGRAGSPASRAEGGSLQHRVACRLRGKARLCCPFERCRSPACSTCPGAASARGSRARTARRTKSVRAPRAYSSPWETPAHGALGGLGLLILKHSENLRNSASQN